jgi:hypothetical protein
VGRQVTASTFTPSTDAPVPDVEEILFSTGKLYIDAVSTDFGVTQISNSFLSMDLSVTTGFQAVYTSEGFLYFSYLKNVGPEIVLNITFEHDGNATAEKSNWRLEVPRKIRVEFTGSALSSTGGTYDNKKLLIDLVGKWEDFEAISDQDGNDTVTGTFRARYNSVAAMRARFTVVNELSSIP